MRKGQKAGSGPTYYSMEPENLPGEEWRPLRGYEGLYAVSSFGRVRSFWRRREGQILRPTHNSHHEDRKGYLWVYLKNGIGGHYHMSIHVAVLGAFVGPRPSGHTADHYPDPDTWNNRADNLRWIPAEENRPNAHTHRQRRRRVAGNGPGVGI